MATKGYFTHPEFQYKSLTGYSLESYPEYLFLEWGGGYPSAEDAASIF